MTDPTAAELLSNATKTEEEKKPPSPIKDIHTRAAFDEAIRTAPRV